MSDRALNVCFHGIGTPQRTLEPNEDVYWVGVDQFQGLLDEVLRWPAVRLSFDDSNLSDLTIALPALRERGVQADFFVLAGRLTSPGSLDPDGVRELQSHGMTIGSHGMHHRPWRALDGAATKDEFVAARERLEDVTQSTVDTAACPLGRYDRGVLGSLKRLGYRRVFTSDRLAAKTGAWLQPRFSVHRDDTPESLRAAVAEQSTALAQARGAAVGLVKRWR